MYYALAPTRLVRSSDKLTAVVAQEVVYGACFMYLVSLMTGVLT